MITWTPIAEMPERCKDGREVLFWFPNGGYAVPLVWKQYGNGFIRSCDAGEFDVPIWSVWELSHFSEINPPAEGEGATP